MNKHGFPGVSWHSRYKKFEARMIVAGRTLSLGSYDTAEEAGAAYQAARAGVPIPAPQERKALGENIASVVRGLRDTALRVGHHFEMPDDGQRYTLTRLETRTAGDGRSYTVQHWSAPCRTCGEAFDCELHPQNKGIVRTCDLHRKSGRGQALRREAKLGGWLPVPAAQVAHAVQSAKAPAVGEDEDGLRQYVHADVAALLLPAWMPAVMGGPFRWDALEYEITASREENVSLRTVCELLGLEGVGLGVEGYRVAIRRLRATGLLHRAGEVALVAQRERTSFEGAIAIVGVGEDFV